MGHWTTFFPLWEHQWAEIAFRMLVAVVCGGALGLERSKSGRSAGFRTYALVALAACALVASLEAAAKAGFLQLGSNAFGIVDAQSRMIQGLLTGVGFLGGGVIVRDGLNVRGLTTAASVWLTSAIGVITGLGMGWIALFITGLGLLILTSFRKIEGLVSRDYYAQLVVRVREGSGASEDSVREILARCGLRVASSALKLRPGRVIELDASVYYTDPAALARFSKELLALGDKIDTFEVSTSPDG